MHTVLSHSHLTLTTWNINVCKLYIYVFDMIDCSCIGTQQLQQDPLDPTKWQIINTNSPLVVTTSLANGGSMTTIKAELDKPKTRLRRVACTCPNCTDIDARYIHA